MVIYRSDPEVRDAARLSPLAAAALDLIGESATPSDIAERFAAAGATVDPIRAAALLATLGELGLVRVARHDGDARVHVPTTLGRQLRDAAPGSNAEIARRLAELERLRTDLLSTIAHELRTPLTAVRTCVGVLRDPAATPTAAELETLLATIERNADRMQRIVGDILEIARFRAGEVVLQLRPFDARDLARNVIASVAPIAGQRHQEITLETPSVPVLVYGDHRRLEQALVNLVSNAVKYGPPDGQIGVRVQTDGEVVSWSVTDVGPGVPEEDRPHLFERFFVGRNDLGGGSRGVGLGLPTALAIAQAHGGRIDVANGPERGSVFTLVIPAAGPHDID